MVQTLIRYKKVVVIVLLIGLMFGTLFGFGPQNSFAANGKDSVQSSRSGCYVAVCTGGWVKGHEDYGCFALATLACQKIFKSDPVAEGVCEAAAFWSCWVDTYCAYWDKRWVDPCPHSVEPTPQPSFNVKP